MMLMNINLPVLVLKVEAFIGCLPLCYSDTNCLLTRAGSIKLITVELGENNGRSLNHKVRAHCCATSKEWRPMSPNKVTCKAISYAEQVLRQTPCMLFESKSADTLLSWTQGKKMRGDREMREYKRLHRHSWSTITPCKYPFTKN